MKTLLVGFAFAIGMVFASQALLFRARMVRGKAVTTSALATMTKGP
jgi:hypothetical protein